MIFVCVDAEIAGILNKKNNNNIFKKKIFSSYSNKGNCMSSIGVKVILNIKVFSGSSSESL